MKTSYRTRHQNQLQEQNYIKKHYIELASPFSLMKKKLRLTAVKIIHFFSKTEIQQTNNSQEISHTILRNINNQPHLINQNQEQYYNNI